MTLYVHIARVLLYIMYDLLHRTLLRSINFRLADNDISVRRSAALPRARPTGYAMHAFEQRCDGTDLVLTDDKWNHT